MLFNFALEDKIGHNKSTQATEWNDHSPSHSQIGSYDVIKYCTNYELPELEKSLLLLVVA